jgi:hypothetical protein
MCRILSILFFTFWFTIFLPGHERGVIKVPGELTCSSSTDSCCPEDQAPKEDPAATCAICQLIATLDTPLAILDITPVVERLQYFRQATPQRIVGRLVRLSIRQRAPPTAMIV